MCTFIYNCIYVGKELSSSQTMGLSPQERIDENHPWVTDDDKLFVMSKTVIECVHILIDRVQLYDTDVGKQTV